MDSDRDFVAALATMAVVVASVVLVYMLVTYLRSRAAERRGREASIAANADEPAPEPVYFRRYTKE